MCAGNELGSTHYQPLASATGCLSCPLNTVRAINSKPDDLNSCRQSTSALRLAPALKHAGRTGVKDALCFATGARKASSIVTRARCVRPRSTVACAASVLRECGLDSVLRTDRTHRAGGQPMQVSRASRRQRLCALRRGPTAIHAHKAVNVSAELLFRDLPPPALTLARTCTRAHTHRQASPP